MNPVTISLTLASSLSSGISLNQTLGSAANLALNGTLVSGGIATFDVARRVAITSVGNDSGINWVLVGTDRYGNPETETFAGGVSVATYSVYDYLTIKSIHATGATAAGVTAGTNGVGSTAWYLREFGSLGRVGVNIILPAGGTTQGNFELTFDDPNAAQAATLVPYQTSVNPQSNIPPKVTVAAITTTQFPTPGTTPTTTSTIAQIDVPFFAWRWTTTSGTSASIVQVIETTQWFQGVF